MKHFPNFKRVKKIKFFKKKINNYSKKIKNTKYFRGTFCVKLTTYGYFSIYQVEAARRVIARITQRKTRIWIRLGLNVSITKKGEKSRMGKGKGKLRSFCYQFKPGNVLFDLEFFPLNINSIKLKLLLEKKLGVPCLILKKK